MRSTVRLAIFAGLATILFAGAGTANSGKFEHRSAREPVSILAQASMADPGPKSLGTSSGEGQGGRNKCNPDGFKETFRNPPDIS
jgi:hypothetical protein